MVDIVDAREQRGRELVRVAQIRRVGRHWVVPSQSSASERYLVDVEESACTCPDYEERRGTCKHQHAVLFWIAWGRDVGEDGTVTEILTVKRKTYRQPCWSTYNASQVHEREYVERLLAALCAGIAEVTYEDWFDRKHGKPRAKHSCEQGAIIQALACALHLSAACESWRCSPCPAPLCSRACFSTIHPRTSRHGWPRRQTPSLMRHQQSQPGLSAILRTITRVSQPDDVSEVPPDDTSDVLALTQPPDDVSRALIEPPDVPIASPELRATRATRATTMTPGTPRSFRSARCSITCSGTIEITKTRKHNGHAMYRATSSRMTRRHDAQIAQLGAVPARRLRRRA